METTRCEQQKKTSTFSLRVLTVFILLTIPIGLLFHEWLQGQLLPSLGLPASLLGTLAFGTLLSVLVAGCNHLLQRKTKTELAELHRQHQPVCNLFQDIPDFLVVLNRDLRIQYCNWQGCYATVPEERRVSGIRCHEAFYPDQDGTCNPCHALEVFASGQPITQTKHNPRIGYLEIRCFPIFDKKGQVSSVAEQICDVTQRVLADKAFKNNEKKLQSILHSISDPIRVVNKNLNVVWANKAAQKIFGESLLEKNAVPCTKWT